MAGAFELPPFLSDKASLMPMFICLAKDKWVAARCGGCQESCGLGHPVTQEHGTRLFGQGFDTRKPAQPPKAEDQPAN